MSNATGCWSLVDTQSYKPAQSIFAGFRVWPKTLREFGPGAARLAAISGCPVPPGLVPHPSSAFARRVGNHNRQLTH